MSRSLKTLIVAALAVACVSAIAAPGDRRTGAASPQASARFAAMDRNSDGGLDRGEVAAAAPRWAEKFDRIDRDKNQRLEPREIRIALHWMAAQRELAKARRDAVRAHFIFLDTDGDRALTLAEIGGDAPELAAKFAVIDTDRNGQVAAEELRAHIASEREARRRAL